MDPSLKKRKADENGALTLSPSTKLSLEDARKIIESFSQDQLVDIVADALCRDTAILDAVRAVANRDTAQRKLFIRGLGWETTTDKLRAIFSQFGELEEAVVITDKGTGKSKGYGFITFRNIDGAFLSLKEPSKKIDGRMTVTQLASTGVAGATGNNAAPAVDVSQRKIFVGGVPADMPTNRLRQVFSSFGEIDEGPLGLDKVTGKFRGYALFVYKTVDAAQAAIAEPVKSIDGFTLQCKLAVEGKKGRTGGSVAGAGAQAQQMALPGSDADGMGMGSQSSLPGSLSSQFGGPGGGGFPSYGNFSGNGVIPGVAASFGQHHHMNSALQPSIGLGNAGMPSVGSQAPSSLGGGSGAGGYGNGLSVGPYGSSGQYAGSGGYGGLGMGSSLYRMLPAGSGGMPSSGYPESGQYSSSMYQSQHHQPSGTSPGPRVAPGGGMYPNMPHYF